MTKTITFNELRRIKDSLPDGSTHRIADELGLSVETVRNYFGGHNYREGNSCGVHIEPGPDGGLVVLDDTSIFERALQILAEKQETPAEAPTA
ncbi:DNA-binding protein [Parabacteroides pacaensis]|uniref:DNA-binding protein n=1 Tax=Parabacteroides pacaensis TaxID=2086575 RepID=UPI000D0ED75D|nr:DNA-binding protein [Parabacteroides pacaensis]